MTKLVTNQIRDKFINYFVNTGHIHLPASSLIPHNDPSLMFVNSGMVQFKDLFTNIEQRSYNKAVTSQKVVRAGGKHNDLDNVGYTARHHTFFEMLGNFSFGDYFKEQAIYYAWNLLVKEFGINKDKLYVTVYHTDDEAANYWKKIANLEDSRIIRIKTNDNFWSMGDSGPCGPCSEIFYDHGDHIYGGLPGTKEEDGDRFVEIWNMVFMQFEQIDKDKRIELPKKSIDTGMGFERISAVLQGVHDNYDIDIFVEIIKTAEAILQIKPVNEAKFSYRVIADHLRSCSFLIADGIMPANEGRGYVLRRIMRRGMRHAHQLGAKDPLMCKLLPKLVELMGVAYPELKRAEDFIYDVLKQEEIRFRNTLDRGLKLLDEELCNLGTSTELSGKVAFKLYDTYGFPLDLTEDILKNKQISVDRTGFEQEMTEQKIRAKKSWVGSGASKTDNLWFDIKAEFGSTEFLGYALDTLEANVIALVLEGARVNVISDLDKEFTLVANQSPFYGESGGQMGDRGLIESPSCTIEVINTIKYLGSIHGHVCILKKGQIKQGESIKLHINTKYRNNLRIHHSATHILHAVLREVLGKHVTQKGSLVAEDRLRFDFSHPVALTQLDIELIEDKVNAVITNNSQVKTVLMSTEEAINSGATALFGEKYDSEVRVVSMGANFIIEEPYSVELCGGTHVAYTGNIGTFKIISESAIAAGVRRIEAVCGQFALNLARENELIISQISDIIKSTRADLTQKINALLLSRKELEKKITSFKTATLHIKSDDLDKESIKINNIRLLYKVVENIESKILRSLAEQLSSQHNDLVVIFVDHSSDKLSITVAVSKEISSKHMANEIAKQISHYLGGNGGGGRATLAQAGGAEVSKLPQLLQMLTELLNNY